MFQCMLRVPKMCSWLAMFLCVWPLMRTILEKQHQRRRRSRDKHATLASKSIAWQSVKQKQDATTINHPNSAMVCHGVASTAWNSAYPSLDVRCCLTLHWPSSSSAWTPGHKKTISLRMWLTQCTKNVGLLKPECNYINSDMKESHFLLRVSFTRCTLWSFGNTLKPQEKWLLISQKEETLPGLIACQRCRPQRFFGKFMDLSSRASRFKLLQPFLRRRPSFNSSMQQLAAPEKLLEVNLTITILVDFLSGCHWYIHLKWQQAAATRGLPNNTWKRVYNTDLYLKMYIYIYIIYISNIYIDPTSPKKKKQLYSATPKGRVPKWFQEISTVLMVHQSTQGPKNVADQRLGWLGHPCIVPTWCTVHSFTLFLYRVFELYERFALHPSKTCCQFFILEFGMMMLFRSLKSNHPNIYWLINHNKPNTNHLNLKINEHIIYTYEMLYYIKLSNMTGKMSPKCWAFCV